VLANVGRGPRPAGSLGTSPLASVWMMASYKQKAVGAALAAKRGEHPVSELKGASRDMYESMSEGELEEMASTKRKGKPEHVSTVRANKLSLK
jgi:hypothetical protein